MIRLFIGGNLSEERFSPVPPSKDFILVFSAMVYYLYKKNKTGSIYCFRYFYTIAEKTKVRLRNEYEVNSLKRFSSITDVLLLLRETHLKCTQNIFLKPDLSRAEPAAI